MFQHFQKLIGILLLFCSLGLPAWSQSAAIEIDGKFEDWTNNISKSVDQPDNKKGVNLEEMQVTNDENYLFIRIKTEDEFDLSDNLLAQNLILCIDVDNNPNTGEDIRSYIGAEIVIRFKERNVEINYGTKSQKRFSEIGFRSAPTVTSNEFEIAIDRNSLPGGKTIFPSDSITLLLLDTGNGDIIPSGSKGMKYHFDKDYPPPYEPIELKKENEKHIRIVAYNVRRDGIDDANNQPHFKLIIQALNPDIIAFSEVYNTSASTIKTLMDRWIPLGTNKGWYVVKKSGSDLITASKWSIARDWDILPRQHPVLIDLPNQLGEQLLLTNAHLKCCDGDEQRQDQVDAYASFIIDAKSRGGNIDLTEGTPIIYGGDLNLVGYAQQLKTLVTGDIQNESTYGKGAALDWDDTDFMDENYLHSDQAMNYTWINDNGTYPPGKLDFLIYSDAVLETHKSFILETESMTNSRLSKYNLERNNTRTASDHLPVVMDVSVKNHSATKSLRNSSIKIYPNPSKGSFFIDNLNLDHIENIQLSNILGQSTRIKTTNHGNSIEVQHFSKKGIYFLEIIYKDGRLVREQILIE